jgi:hypothetical protein
VVRLIDAVLTSLHLAKQSVPVERSKVQSQDAIPVCECNSRKYAPCTTHIICEIDVKAKEETKRNEQCRIDRSNQVMAVLAYCK